MIRLFVLALLFFTIPFDGHSRAVKLGDMSGQQQTPLRLGYPRNLYKNAEISCFENKDCPYDRECVALRCESVCKVNICPTGSYCAPAGENKPHEYKCVECVINAHCEKGMYCERDYTCKKIDPCIDAVCSPAAPHCMPKPYKSLPYTCVQCLEDSHCPPVAGLSRRCVDGYCLFNVEGNIPAQQKAEKVPEKEQELLPVEEDNGGYDDYSDEYGYAE